MSNLNSLRESLAKKQAEVAALEQELRSAQESQFTELPAKLGLESIDAVIKALAPYASPRLRGVLSKAVGARVKSAPVAVAPAGEKPAVAPARVEKRKRAKVTPELKEQIVAALQAGEKIAAEVAAEFGVSVPTVNNIKRDAGLTKKKEA